MDCKSPIPGICSARIRVEAVAVAVKVGSTSSTHTRFRILAGGFLHV